MDSSNQVDIIHPASSMQDVALTATMPADMVVAQHQLIVWCEKKVQVVKAEVEELRAAADHAKEMKWKSGTLENQHAKAVKSLSYYEKVKAALVAGYYIVPNFPLQMFAIRKRGNRRPTGYSERLYAEHQQKASELPAGEGEYRNPFPLVERVREEIDGKVEVCSYPEEWDQMEFPITMAKAPIMEATSSAMGLKVFDQIGVMPATRKKEDPVIVGQIINKVGYRTKIVSFMIAWHLDTRVL